MKPHQFKHGDKVTCEIEGRKIKDAKISKDNEYSYDSTFICQNIISGSKPIEIFEYKYGWRWDANVENVQPLKITKETGNMNKGREFNFKLTK